MTTVIDLDQRPAPAVASSRPARWATWLPWCLAAVLAAAAGYGMAGRTAQANPAPPVAHTITVGAWGDPRAQRAVWVDDRVVVPPFGEPTLVSGQLRAVLVVVDVTDADREIGCAITVDGVRVDRQALPGPRARAVCLYLPQ